MQHDIRLAGEIAIDQDVRPLKAVWPVPVPVQFWICTLPLTVTLPSSNAETQLTATTLPPIVDGSSIRVDEKSGTGSGRNVAGHIHEAKGTGGARRDGNIPIDGERLPDAPPPTVPEQVTSARADGAPARSVVATAIAKANTDRIRLVMSAPPIANVARFRYAQS